MIWSYFNGTASESNYPYYSGANGGYTPGAAACSGLSKAISSFGATILNEYDIVGLQNAVAVRPITVLVYASNWFSYAGGVFNDCQNVAGNHIVELVGYNSSVWVIKNSWGTNWGSQGFIYLNMSNPLCGDMISTYAVAPAVAKPEADLDPYCMYYGSYCTDFNYLPYMMRKTFIY